MAKGKINFEDEQVRSNYRHTTSHILAQAVKKLWPDAKLAIGPSIENGFYYDFDMEHKLNDQDLLKIQKEMKKIIQANYTLERFELPRDEAIKFMADKHEDYKVELIEDLPEDEVISFYRQGDFVDLCAEEIPTDLCSRGYTEHVSLHRPSWMNTWHVWKKQRKETIVR